jgi:hypothetical protein
MVIKPVSVNSEVNSIHLLDLTRSSCEKCNNNTIGPLAGIKPAALQVKLALN